MKKLFFMLICVLIIGSNTMVLGESSNKTVVITVESNLEKTSRILHLWNQSDEILHVFTCANIVSCNGKEMQNSCQNNKPIPGVDIIQNSNNTTTYKDSYFKKLSTYVHTELQPNEKADIKSSFCNGVINYKWHSITQYFNEAGWAAFQAEFINQDPTWKP